jgi:hypothetical protein
MYNCAVGHKAGMIPFELSETNHGDHQLRVSATQGLMGETGRSCVMVEMRTLYDICQSGLRQPLAVKIDVQGAEALVFEGARRTIAQAGLLIAEFWPYGLNRAGGDCEAIFEAINIFTSVAIVRDDETRLDIKMTPGEAADFLRAFIRDHSSDHNLHVDLVLRR